MGNSHLPDPPASLSARPLLATRADMALFAGRGRELKEFERALAQRFNVLVVCERGAGRTSLLRALMYHWSPSTAPDPWLVYVRAAGLTDPEQVLEKVLEAYDRIEEVDVDSTPGVRSLGSASALVALAQRQQAHPIVVLLDDVDPVVGNALFGVLRDELWETRTTWVVTATPEGATTILAPPADAFFEVILRIQPLSSPEAIDLLKRRLPKADPSRLAAIAREGGRPREIIERARQVDWDSPVADEALNTVRRGWEYALSRLGRPATMLAAEMQDLGPVSASDEVLQQRMGWTRPRALQVLSELEAAGLATSASPPRTGPGRPKKIYRLLTPYEWAATHGHGKAS
jgi:hypothetical protein